ncbi:hypothetical protein Acr_16g0001100 [Actinidia rufa]|uniref:Retrotransposon gag domain-containing protein n=1 Tax=Actinidia rufa TaxID=165716 RepID=A0A7J0FXU1_9ERIC|nr:hypothetical protein Acr_16g0001100 [Actinidia rufa]
MVCSLSFTPQQFGTVCGNDSSQLSMHLRSRLLPRPNASSPLDNRAHPMANTSKVPDLEGLYCEIHGMAEKMRETTIPGTIVLAEDKEDDVGHQVLPDVKIHLPQSPNRPVRPQKWRARKPGEEDLLAKTELPFTERVLRTRVSSRFKLPTQLETYEGKTDPMDHLDSYKSLMSLQGCSDEVMYKAFSATLKGSARSWFRKLPPGTIDSFGNLSRLFVANFMSCRIRQKNASHLFIVHQKETEVLKDYVKRFNQAVLEVKDPSDKVVIMAMMEGLRPGPLFDSLSKNVPETFSALQSKADKYIAAEELAEAKRKRRGKDDHKRKEPDARRPNYKDEARSKRPDRDSKQTNERRPRTPPRCPELILPPLNAPIARIADLIKKEYLRKYVTNRLPPNSPERRYGDNRPITGDIQMIHGGFGSVRYLSSSRKRHARSAHGRAGEEIYNLSSPVVNAVIANFNVQRILVDNGSSADILFISAFEKMRIVLDKLHPFHTPLVGFGGNMTHPLGWIKLPVTLGTEPHQITAWQDFIVVDCPSPYNAILGRSTLGGTRAITSTYHLKMKFPISTGVGEVRGDQKVARQCFISAMKVETSASSAQQQLQITDDEMDVLRDEVEQITLADPRETENTKPLEEVAPISIHPDLS